MNIEERKPIWIALSNFYLDTELEDSDLKHIALTIIKSPYSLDDIKKIDKYELHPVLQSNLLSIAGEWGMFNEDRLVERIIRHIKKTSKINKVITEVSYKSFKWMLSDYWERLEKIYNKLNTNINNNLKKEK